jgi:hypothetical protein
MKKNVIFIKSPLLSSFYNFQKESTTMKTHKSITRTKRKL